MTPISSYLPVAGLGDTVSDPATKPSLEGRGIEEVAHQFESMFVSLLLKEMRQTLSEGLFGGDNSDSYGALFDMYMGQHLAEGGALGIGQMVASEYLNAADL